MAFRDTWLGKLFFNESIPTPNEEGLIQLDPIRYGLLENHINKTGIGEPSAYVTKDQYESYARVIEGFANTSRIMNRSYTYSNTSASAYQVSAAYGALYTQIQSQRRRIMDQIDEVSAFYLVDVIIETCVEDALTPDIQTGEVFEFKSKNPTIQKELEDLDKRFKLDHLVRSFLGDGLKYGEYTFSTEVRRDPKIKTSSNSESADYKLSLIKEDLENETYDNSREPKPKYGLLEINDTVDQSSVVPITKDHEIDYYLKVDYSGSSANIRQVPRTDYVRFTYNFDRMRVDLHKEFNQYTPQSRDIIASLPRFIRVGKSVIYPLLGKLKELMLLEQLAPATKLSKLSSGTIVSLKVPPGYEIEQALEACHQIEGVLNKKVGINKNKSQLDLAEILASSGQIKVVPDFGDKGSMERLDVRGSEPDNITDDANSLRSLILDAFGIPAELIFKNDTAEGKSDLLKRYARYLRKLKNIQRAVIDFLYQIVSIHLANKGIEWAREDVEINFRNKLVELDNIDKLEFLDTAVGMLTNVNQFVSDISDADTSKIGSAVELQAYVDYLEEQFNLMGLKGLINSKGYIKQPIGQIDPDGNLAGQSTDSDIPSDDKE